MKVPKIQTVCGFGCGSSLMLRMNVEKIAKALGLSSDHPFVKFLGGFFNNSSFSIQEISSNIFWKILIIACLVFLIITLGILTKTFIKSRAK